MVPRETVSFVFSQVLMFPMTSFRETSGLSRKQNLLFPPGPYIKRIIRPQKGYYLVSIRDNQEMQLACMVLIKRNYLLLFSYILFGTSIALNVNSSG